MLRDIDDLQVMNNESETRGRITLRADPTAEGISISTLFPNQILVVGLVPPAVPREALALMPPASKSKMLLDGSPAGKSAGACGGIEHDSASSPGSLSSSSSASRDAPAAVAAAARDRTGDGDEIQPPTEADDDDKAEGVAVTESVCKKAKVFTDDVAEEPPLPED